MKTKTLFGIGAILAIALISVLFRLMNRGVGSSPEQLSTETRVAERLTSGSGVGYEVKVKTGMKTNEVEFYANGKTVNTEKKTGKPDKDLKNPVNFFSDLNSWCF